ncbi:13772_t:CDS:10 [Gigaspora margarita]|uniref:tRNA (guanine-N(1)-)-methyltransferase n=1 Tax=Gigaspora margarita TaxID=4874 RepID=A0ABM8VZU3_GIGMA|nr:13772_t:CDS:10 [Gigaspora margarita]
MGSEQSILTTTENIYKEPSFQEYFDQRYPSKERKDAREIDLWFSSTREFNGNLDLSEFVNLERIRVKSGEKLTSLDLRQNTKLVELRFENTKLTKLDLGNNHNLKRVNIDQNGAELSLAVFSRLFNLELLFLSNSKFCGELKELNGCKKLKELKIENNKGRKEIDGRLEDLPNRLTCFKCDGRVEGYKGNERLEQEIPRRKRKKKEAFCVWEKKIGELDCSLNKITFLDLSNCPNLEKLDCEDNEIEKLELSKNEKLIKLNCSSNNLKKLNLENNLNLEVIDVKANKIEANLNIFSHLTKLRDLEVGIRVLKTGYAMISKFMVRQDQLSTNSEFSNNNNFSGSLAALINAVNTKFQEIQNASKQQLQELTTSLFPNIRVREDINLEEGVMEDMDNFHQQSSSSKTLQEFSEDYLTLNRENRQQKARIRELENEITTLKTFAELEKQELAAKIQALKKYNAISEYYVFPYRQNLERIFANEKGGGIKNKIISSQLQRELRQIVSEKELPLSFISLERVINETEYSEDYEVISTIAKLEKLKPRSVEFIKFKKKHIRQILEKNTFLNELTLIEEKEGTEFFICVSLLLDSIKRKEKEIDSLEYKKLQAARENAITEINNLLTPEEQEIVYSHQIQINIPYLEILPTYCGCEILPPSLQLPFFGRQKYKYNPEQRDKYFVANGHYPEYEQIHYHHIENCLKTLEQINEFKNQVIAAIQKERPIFKLEPEDEINILTKTIGQITSSLAANSPEFRGSKEFKHVLLRQQNYVDYPFEPELQWDYYRGKVDDYPYGGGAGMLLKIEPLVYALANIQEIYPQSYFILLSPQGKKFQQKEVARLLNQTPNLVFICGRYEGFDERIINYVDEQISVGDFITMGGEIPALAITEALIRAIPGAIQAESYQQETFTNSRLDYANYAPPRVFEDLAVPEVLLSGHHQKIAVWREENIKKKVQSSQGKQKKKKPLPNPNKWRLIGELFSTLPTKKSIFGFVRDEVGGKLIKRRQAERQKKRWLTTTLTKPKFNESKLTISVSKPEYTLSEEIREKLAKILKIVVENQNISGLVSLSLISKKTSQKLNLRYRKINKSTDVLAFPFYYNYQKEIGSCSTGKLRDLGDIFICYPVAQEQAQENQHSLFQEICFLFLHGLLHLLGYDHEKDKDRKIMFELQDQILEQANLKI